MASFLQIRRHMRGYARSTVLCGLLLPLLATCGAEEPPRLTAAGPRPAEISRPGEPAGQRGATLAATGRQSYQGATSLLCVEHAQEGLQMNFRTSDADIPVVAVRIPDFHGSGPYRARLFVTGRSRTGGLISSTGEANVQVKQQEPPDGAPAVLLSGSFTGAYGGQAGRGSVEGRFDRCSCPARGSSPPPAGKAAAP
jgi:hypothetical protein